MTQDQDDQKIAASHIGSHARLLAGPGTGKTTTLTKRVCSLIKKRIDPHNIVVLTFTRAAAYNLRQEISRELSEYEIDPSHISTLHSFALRQLLKNLEIVDRLPLPLRIADDYEERCIIQKDIKDILGLNRIDDVKDKFNHLSSDWQSLKADEEDWEKRYPDPRFLGAWQEHREAFGYTLRSELVYQLKRALEQSPDFHIEEPIDHLLVDEYQDLNRCDLALIKEITERGAELFCAGDDDQSIYGFRGADPEGIRRFPEDYSQSTLLELEYCRRCDRKVLDLACFVANLDPRRIPKPLKPMKDARDGEVRILYFENQMEEANSVARLCHYLCEHGYEPGKIMILLRSDRYGAFSNPLKDALEAQEVPVAVKSDSPLDTNEGRELFSILKLSIDLEDHLAWRTLLQIRNNRIGKKALSDIYNLARRDGIRFYEALCRTEKSPELFSRFGRRVVDEMENVRKLVSEFSLDIEDPRDFGLLEGISHLAERLIDDGKKRDKILNYLQEMIESSGAANLKQFLSTFSTSMGDDEQEIEIDKVNIMTMHKAKGLTADVVFIVAAEDEYIPGRQIGEKVDDERRLLYVSLTRAKHLLFITYCHKRTGQQRHTGRDSGQLRRDLTRFLRDSPIRPGDGDKYLHSVMKNLRKITKHPDTPGNDRKGCEED
jgi:DNA helicase-2/ATP-dependent DNA helicase PcrA